MLHKRERNFQLCTPEDAQRQSALWLMLNNLCLYTVAVSRFYEIEFKQTSVIPCQELHLSNFELSSFPKFKLQLCADNLTCREFWEAEAGPDDDDLLLFFQKQNLA